MNRVLSLLLAYVFMQVQTWALSGGPVFAGQLADLSGTYSGVMAGSSALNGGLLAANNSLGVFVLGVPKTGAAQGSAVLFQEGSFFQGGILGVADPDEGTMKAIAQLVRIFSKQSTTGQGGTGTLSLTFDGRADGIINADIDSNGQGGSVRLKGTAVFTVKLFNFTTFNFDTVGTLNFAISGFKQSTEVVLPSANSTAGLLNQ